MSAEQNSPMDPLLRELARKRREQPGAPTSIHPANRRVLAAEIKNVYGGRSKTEPQSKTQPPWWFRWPGLVGLGSAVTLICISLIWLAGEKQAPTAKFAKVEVSREDNWSEKRPSGTVDSVAEMPVSAPPPLPAPTPLGAVAEKESVVKLQDATTRGDKADSFDAGKTVQGTVRSLDKKSYAAERPSVATDARADNRKVEGLDSARFGQPVVPEKPERDLKDQAVASATKQENLGRLGGLSGATADSGVRGPQAPSLGFASYQPTMSLYFQQVSNLNGRALGSKEDGKDDSLSKAKGAAKPKVMEQFQLNYANGTMEIIDRDGSVYQGSLTPVAPAEPTNRQYLAARNNQRGEAVQGLAINSQVVEAGRYRFQASGTNRSLRERVTLAGELTTSPVPATTPLPQLKPAAPSYSVNQPLQQPYSWSFNSTLQIGRTTPLEVNAVQIQTNGIPYQNQR